MAAAGVAAAVALLALPSAASAGKVTSDGGRLEITAFQGNNRFLIQRAGGQFRIEDRNPENGFRVGRPCSVERVDDRAVATCPADGVREVIVTPHGNDDRVVIGRRLPQPPERNFCAGSHIGAPLTVSLGAGNDFAELSDGDDVARGGTGPDVILGCDGDDLITGDYGGDSLSGDRGDDELRGQSNDDRLIGCLFDPDDVNYPRDEPGADALHGGEGGDFLFGCNGNDAYDAALGDDYLNTRDAISELANCGPGADVIYMDPQDSRPGCEVVTDCVTDNFPIGPDTGVPDCFRSRLNQ